MTGLLMKYFVLKPEGADRYAAYAEHIREENPELANQLRDWADTEQAKAL
jgi:hypothetical protein